MKATKATVIYIIKNLKQPESLYTAVQAHGLNLETLAFDKNALVLTNNGKPVLREDLHVTLAAIEGVAQVRAKTVMDSLH